MSNELSEETSSDNSYSSAIAMSSMTSEHDSFQSTSEAFASPTAKEANCINDHDKSINNEHLKATSIDNMFFWHDKDIDLGEICKHLPHISGRTFFAVSVYEPFVFYHDRDLALKKNQSFIKNLYLELTEKQLVEMTSKRRYIEYLVTRKVGKPGEPQKCKFDRLTPLNESAEEKEGSDENDEEKVEKSTSVAANNQTDATTTSSNKTWSLNPWLQGSTARTTKASSSSSSTKTVKPAHRPLLNVELVKNIVISQVEKNAQVPVPKMPEHNSNESVVAVESDDGLTDISFVTVNVNSAAVESNVVRKTIESEKTKQVATSKSKSDHKHVMDKKGDKREAKRSKNVSADSQMRNGNSSGHNVYKNGGDDDEVEILNCCEEDTTNKLSNRHHRTKIDHFLSSKKTPTSSRNQYVSSTHSSPSSTSTFAAAAETDQREGSSNKNVSFNEDDWDERPAAPPQPPPVTYEYYYSSYSYYNNNYNSHNSSIEASPQSTAVPLSSTNATVQWSPPPTAFNRHQPHFDLVEYFKKKQLEWKNFPKNLVDSHCHLDMLFAKMSYRKPTRTYFEDFKSIYLDNFEGCVNVLCDPRRYEKPTEKLYDYLRLFKHNKVYSTIGCHPHFANYWTSKTGSLIASLLGTNGIVAIGECGLDDSHKNSVAEDVQRTVFGAQLDIANETGVPLVIHCRDAEAQVFEIMKQKLDSNHRIHLHCFTGGWRMAEKYLDHFKNLCVGVTPLITNLDYSNKMVELVINVPLERLLLETDAPYFVPRFSDFPFKTIDYSHPAFVYATAEAVAYLKQVEIPVVLEYNRHNVRRVYGF